jgi:hypothetical protein
VRGPEPRGGWRTLAQATGLPPWQLRRLSVLLCGAPNWRGLIEVMTDTGHVFLHDSGRAERHPNNRIGAYLRHRATSSELRRLESNGEACSKLYKASRTVTLDAEFFGLLQRRQGSW